MNLIDQINNEKFPLPKWISISLGLLSLFCLTFTLIFLREFDSILWPIILLINGIAVGIAAFRPLYFWWLIFINAGLSAISIVILIWKAFSLLFDSNLKWDQPNGLVMMFLIQLAICWTILYHLYQYYIQEKDLSQLSVTLDQAIKETFIPSKNATLSELSQDSPLLIIFLRYLGCTLCRQTLHNIKKNKQELEKKGFQIVFVHMNTQEQGLELFKHYDLENMIQISDPDRHLYHAFGLHRFRLFNLLTPALFRQYAKTTLIEGHGPIDGDLFQRPGVFIIFKNQLLYAFYPAHIGEQVNYNEISNLNDADKVLQFMTTHIHSPPTE